jgi:prepilin-type N-terminal cleavage/methylation domain-containing protein
MLNVFKNNKGFTIFELILVIAIFAIIFSSTAIVFGNMLNENRLASKGYEIVQSLREARTNAVSQKENSKWGVYLETSTAPDRYIVFKGDSYASRDSAFDQTVIFSSSVIFSNIDISGGNEIVFGKRSGETENIGSFDLVTENERFNVTVNRLGLIDYNY